MKTKPIRPATQKFYVTKWALTKGVIEMEGEQSCNSDKYVWFAGAFGGFAARLGQAAFHTEAEANARVIDMAKRKLKALEKQREKLERILEERGEP
jgi:hypothetical protein